MRIAGPQNKELIKKMVAKQDVTIENDKDLVDANTMYQNMNNLVNGSNNDAQAEARFPGIFFKNKHTGEVYYLRHVNDDFDPAYAYLTQRDEKIVRTNVLKQDYEIYDPTDEELRPQFGPKRVNPSKIILGDYFGENTGGRKKSRKNSRRHRRKSVRRKK